MVYNKNWPNQQLDNWKSVCKINLTCHLLLTIKYKKTSIQASLMFISYDNNKNLSNHISINVRLIGRSGVRINFWMMPTGVSSGYSTLKVRMMWAIAMCSSRSATRRPAGQKNRTVYEEGQTVSCRLINWLHDIAKTNLHTCVAQTQRIRSWMRVVSPCSLCSIALAWSAQAQERYAAFYQL